jgi:hypothetical protein
MDKILEIYNEYHFLVLIFVILFFVIYINSIQKKENITILQNEVTKTNATVEQKENIKVDINEAENENLKDLSNEIVDTKIDIDNYIKETDKSNILKEEIELDSKPNDKKSQLTKPEVFRYTSKRLSFRRETIKKMLDNDILFIEVEGAQNSDNIGVFKLTKKDIDNTFHNVINSVSYKRDGNYNYSKNPKKVNQFKI